MSNEICLLIHKLCLCINVVSLITAISLTAPLGLFTILSVLIIWSVWWIKYFRRLIELDNMHELP